MGAIGVFLCRDKIPTVNQWNEALLTEGFDLIIDAFDLEKENGYRPAMLCGRETAFDWFLHESLNYLADDECTTIILPQIGDRDVLTDLDGKEESEEVAGRIAGAVLAKITDGLYWDKEQSTIMLLKGNEAIEVARKALSDWKKQND